MNGLEYVLTITEHTGDAETIANAAKKFVGQHKTITASNTFDALETLNRIGLRRNEIPVLIFLDTALDLKEGNDFLNLLSSQYGSASRKRVVLLTEDFSLGNITKFAVSETVYQFVKRPVTAVKVKAVIESWSRPTISLSAQHSC